MFQSFSPQTLKTLLQCLLSFDEEKSEIGLIWMLCRCHGFSPPFVENFWNVVGMCGPPLPFCSLLLYINISSICWLFGFWEASSPLSSRFLTLSFFWSSGLFWQSIFQWSDWFPFMADSVWQMHYPPSMLIRTNWKSLLFLSYLCLLQGLLSQWVHLGPSPPSSCCPSSPLASPDIHSDAGTKKGLIAQPRPWRVCFLSSGALRSPAGLPQGEQEAGLAFQPASPDEWVQRQPAGWGTPQSPN